VIVVSAADGRRRTGVKWQYGRLSGPIHRYRHSLLRGRMYLASIGQSS